MAALRTPSPRRPVGRSLSDFEPLSEAEKKLAEATRTGEGCILGRHLPDNGSTRITIRAGVLRFLALGGDDITPVHETGVRLRGAFIEGELDLSNAALPFDLTLECCRFDSSVSMYGARGQTINLNECYLNGFTADRLLLDGGLFLKEVHAERTTRLGGAHIKGDFTCSGALFNGAGGRALHFDGAAIDGAVFLNCGFEAKGTVRLAGAQIGGDFVCDQGHFEKFGDNDYALACDGARIGGSLSFFDGIIVNGIISLAHAEVSTLRDNPTLWPMNSLNLDGFRYQRISSTSSLDAATRVGWLDKQQQRYLKGDNFSLQPWMQLAKVLREQGHFRDAAEVDIAREDRLRAGGRVGYPWIHWSNGKFAGYGHRPDRVLIIAFIVWTVSMGLYALAAENGGFAPTSPAIYLKDEFEHCRPDAQEMPKNGKPKIGNWTHCPDLPSEYPAFSPFAFSTDLILPVMHLGQSNYWGPTTIARKFFSVGNSVQCWMWLEEAFGWVAALTLGAIAAGLVKRRDG